MSDIRTTLNQVLAGTEPPSAFLDAVDTYLAQPDARLDALRSLIDAAEHLGLPPDIAEAARARIPEPDITPIGEPTQVADDGDGERTVLTTSDAPTHLRRDPADVDASDRTEISGPDDRTVVTGDSDRTVVTGDNDRTVVTGDLHRIADSDRTEVTGDSDLTVDAGGIDPFAMASAPAEDDIGPGTVLKGRFRLEEVIGQGGMGAVYKAVDLLKVEARDRNPYMAVKLLVGDFKEHPEAFIALQRESAKAQRLAHPNIATVYDFDRDGDTVYMTMELMVGAELAKYIKKLPAGGLAVPDANKIIEQLCAGLQYAHARGLVHSDFKPGNAFVLDDGSVKLLDFGIARASKTKADAEGESTVFDPGQLGALTPAYATIEMFEGQDPDPRDDIYALACVSYELYTGKHPFNKMSAVKAKEKNLKVAPVAKLNKRQNRTLLKALALHRDDRLPSVEAFWEGLKPRKDYTMQIAGGSIAAIVLVGFLAYGPILNVIHERDHAAIITEIDSGDEARLVAALGQMDALPEQRRRTVAERARERIFDYYRNRAEAAVDEDAGRYGFPAALSEIDALDTYFPRDSGVLELRQDFEARRARLVSGLREAFREHLEADRVMPDSDAEDITDVLVILKAAQPDDPLLNDPRLIGAYVARADAQAQRQRWDEANRIVEVGLQFAPRAPELLDRRDQIAAELQREQEAALIAELRDRLRGARPQSLADFRGLREPLEQLGSLRPADPAVRGLDAALRAAVDRELAALSADGDWAGADALLAEFARTLSIDALIEMRGALTGQQRAAGYDTRGDADHTADLRRRVADIRALLAEPAFDDAFDRALTAQFKELTARADVDNSDWTAIRGEIVDAHVARARALVADNRFVVAAATLTSGAQFHAAAPAFETEREALAAAESEYRAEVARRERLAAIDARKQQLLGYIEGNQLNQARDEYLALRNELPADDPFITTEAPQAIAAGYLALATQAGENNQPGRAVDFAEAGLRILPGHGELSAVHARYRRISAQQDALASVNSVTTQNFGTFRTQYTQGREGLAGADAAQFETRVVTALAQRLTTLDRGGQFAAATQLRETALQLFPNNQRLTQLNLTPPSQFATRINAEIGRSRLSAARELLVQGRRADGDNHPELVAIAEELGRLEAAANQHFEAATASHRAGRRDDALQSINRALAGWTDSVQYARIKEQIESGARPCTADLAGAGGRGGSRAACYDMVAGQRTPAMMVVPAMSGGQPFAIGRFEVTVGEYNHYCTTSGACQRIAGDDGLPVTGISIADADAYLNWLSEATGQRYRLPTSDEWLHAGGAGTDDAGRSADFNCRVTQGGGVMKGNQLLRATSGPANAWGVTNAVGNAQEWVRDGGTLQARGGSAWDPCTAANVTLVRPHSGAADEMTGFRLMRGID